jgi:hypothetical protein
LKLLAVRAAVIVSDIVKGLVKCGSVSYWAVSLSLIPLIIATSAVIAWWLVRKHAAKAAAHHELPEGEVSSSCQGLADTAQHSKPAYIERQQQKSRTSHASRW